MTRSANGKVIAVRRGYAFTKGSFPYGSRTPPCACPHRDTRPARQGYEARLLPPLRRHAPRRRGRPAPDDPRGRADATDHPRAVLVADHEHVVGRRKLDLMAVEHDDAGLTAKPAQGAGDRMRPAAHSYEVDVVAGSG